MTLIYKFTAYTIFFITLVSTACASQPRLSVELPALSVTLNYQQPVRLSKVLTDTQKTTQERGGNTPFWLAAQLLQKDKNEQINQLKNSVLNKLIAIKNADQQSASKAKFLITLISHTDFNYRHFISLDYDLVRIQPELDPLLEGHYQLLIPARANNIRLIGTTVPEHTTPLIAQATLDAYIKNAVLPPNTDSSIIYVIQPDGTLSKQHNAYWYRQPTFLAPGASLYFGFKSLREGDVMLNQQIAELLRHMPPLTKERK